MPTVEPLAELLAFATSAAFEAGRVTLRYFQTSLDVETKADDTPVTRADRETEAFLRDRIGRRFPDHAILGEEHGETGASGAAVRWVLDPIDGTKSFICGVPLYAVLVAAEVDGVSRVGAVYFPGLDEMYAAADGLGATWNGRPCRVSAQGDLSRARLAYTSVNGFHRAGIPQAYERLLASTGLQRGWGDAYAHCLVATGRADLAVEPLLNVWDSAPLLPLLTEAGGTLTDWRGNARHDAPRCLSTNGLLLDATLDLLAPFEEVLS